MSSRERVEVFTWVYGEDEFQVVVPMGVKIGDRIWSMDRGSEVVPVYVEPCVVCGELIPLQEARRLPRFKNIIREQQHIENDHVLKTQMEYIGRRWGKLPHSTDYFEAEPYLHRECLPDLQRILVHDAFRCAVCGRIIVLSEVQFPQTLSRLCGQDREKARSLLQATGHYPPDIVYADRGRVWPTIPMHAECESPGHTLLAAR